MKIGYPCKNNTLGCSANKTFRLKSYSELKLAETIIHNLACLRRILTYNLENQLLFFRISSDTIPFASHDICRLDWLEMFQKDLSEIGNFINEHDMRISMHPGQFTVLNSPKKTVVENSIKELKWHCLFLDALNLDLTAKVQIHVGGVYGNKEDSINNFILEYLSLPELIKQRLVIENDDHLYSLQDCLSISQKINIPIIFDILHHECLNNNEPISQALGLAKTTWQETDGFLMVDYSSQEANGRKGEHAKTIDLKHFCTFLEACREYDLDIMLEIKDKEKSALKAAQIIHRI